MKKLNLLKNSLLVTSLGLGLFLVGCGSSDIETKQEPTSTKSDETKQFERDIANSLTVSNVEEVKVPDRSAFRTVDGDFLELYELKKEVLKIKDTNNIDRENNFPLDNISSHRLFEDMDVFMEKNPVLKMEKARVSVLPKVIEATKDIKEVEYIKVPFNIDQNSHNGPVAYLYAWSKPQGENIFKASMQVTSNSDHLRYDDGLGSFTIGPLTQEQELEIVRGDLIRKNMQGDAYYIVQRDQRRSMVLVPAYLDYKILNEKGDVVYKASVDKF